MPPIVINPEILLDDTIPVEREIFEQYKTQTLDVKSLLIIGHIAVTSSTKHIRADTERNDIKLIKEFYEENMKRLHDEAKEKAEDMARRIIADKDKDIALLKERLEFSQQNQDLQISRAIAEKERELALLREQLNTVCSASEASLTRTNAEKDKEIAVLREQLASLQQNQELYVARAISESRDNQGQEIATYKERIIAAQTRAQELECALQEARASARQNVDELIRNLKNDEIMALQAQIAALKGSNFSKGVVGENSVRNWLSQAFPDCEITDKSGTTAESDLHIVKPNGDFIAVECKNKSAITLQDVEKSMRDVQYLQSKYGNHFVGYIFISLRSTNIPRKGAGTLEMFQDQVPIYWYGQQEFDESDQSCIEFVKAIWTISQNFRTLRQKYCQNDETVEAFQKQLNEIMANIKASLDRLSQNQKSLASLSNSIKIIQDNNNAALQLLGTYIAHYAPLTAVSPSSSCDSANQNHNCPTCNRVFSRKSDLTRHSKTCIGIQPTP